MKIGDYVRNENGVIGKIIGFKGDIMIKLIKSNQQLQKNNLKVWNIRWWNKL